MISDLEKTVIESNLKQYVYSIEWLNPQEETVYEAIVDVISGSASFDCTNNNRRSFTLALRNLDGSYTPAVDSKMWLTNKIKINCGYKYNGINYLYPQGTYILGNPSLLNSPTKKEVSLQNLDKWTLLDGTIGGKLKNQYVVTLGSQIDNVIKSIIVDELGMTNYIIDTCTVTTPYTITKSAGDTYANLIIELCQMASFTAYFDEMGGNFRFRKAYLPADYMAISPTYEYIVGGNFLDSTRELKWNDIKNSVVVWGMTESGTQYTGIAQDTTGSELSIDKIGERVEVISDENIYNSTLCTERANYELKNLIMCAESVTLNVIPNFSHKVEDVITLTDEITGCSGNYVIQQISYNLGFDAKMTLTLWKIRSWS